MRNYDTMREVLEIVAKNGSMNGLGAFNRVRDRESCDDELARLCRDGIISGEVEFDACGTCLKCGIDGLTDEGAEFYRLVENADAWEIIRSTLYAANVDVSYPLLKEVCEEIVKRYVTSFIPEIRQRQK